MKREYAKIIEWKQFDSPSDVRPYGLMMEGSELLDDHMRARLVQIARGLVGPDPVYDEQMEGRWVTTHTCKIWSFASEGARAAFVMATKGDTSVL